MSSINNVWNKWLSSFFLALLEKSTEHYLLSSRWIKPIEVHNGRVSSVSSITIQVLRSKYVKTIVTENELRLIDFSCWSPHPKDQMMTWSWMCSHLMWLLNLNGFLVRPCKQFGWNEFSCIYCKLVSYKNESTFHFTFPNLQKIKILTKELIHIPMKEQSKILIKLLNQIQIKMQQINYILKYILFKE